MMLTACIVFIRPSTTPARSRPANMLASRTRPSISLAYSSSCASGANPWPALPMFTVRNSPAHPYMS